MENDADSSDRGPVSFFLFALGFGAFLLSTGGVILGSPVLALGGAAVLLVSIAAFQLAPSPGD